MADTAIAITAGTGTNVDTRTEATNGNHRQVVVIGDPSTNAGVAPVDVTNGLSVNVTNPSLTVGSHNVTNAGTFAVQAAQASAANLNATVVGTGTFATQSAQSGTWTVQPGNTANTTPWLTSPSTGGNTAAVKAASTAAATTDPALVVAVSPNNYDFGSGTGGTKTQRVIVDSSQFSTLGQAAMAASQPVAIASDQSWPKGLSNRAFSAAFSTLTRPANTTAYTAADSISDNATAGSVTALSATISDVNDDPIFISEILINSTDTGLAGKKLRAYLYNSDPTASTGVGAGDNAAFSNKKAGYIGSFMGWMETGFSDGTVGRLVPVFNETNNTQAGAFITTKPTSGAKTLFIQYQAVEAFTPSANSTTIIGTARGWQARAA